MNAMFGLDGETEVSGREQLPSVLIVMYSIVVVFLNRAFLLKQKSRD